MGFELSLAVMFHYQCLVGSSGVYKSAPSRQPQQRALADKSFGQMH